MRYLYGVRFETPETTGTFRPRFGFRLTTNKRDALRCARMLRGTVGRTAYDTFNGGDQYGIDCPTFFAQADIIANYGAK